MPEQKFNGLDHLRALAILLVMGYHYQLYIFGHPQWTTFFDGFAWAGVDLFFVLSGFLISHQLFKQLKESRTISIKTFYIKRFFRIIPLYLFIVAIYFLIPFFREKEALPPVWRFLTFTQNFNLNLWTNGTFSHAWSLCVEEHFYLFLPIILATLHQFNLLKRAFWLLIILFIAGFILRAYSWYVLFIPKSGDEMGAANWPKYIYYPTYNRLDGLLAGVSIAAVYQFLPGVWNKISRYGNQLIIISLVLLGITFYFFGRLGSYSVTMVGFPLVAICFGLLVAGAVSANSFLYKWDSPVTRQIAVLS